MAAPAMTFDQTLIASAGLNASSSVSGDLDISDKFEAHLQVKDEAGTITAGSGIQVAVYRDVRGPGANEVFDSLPVTSFFIPSTGSTTTRKSFVLPTGHYRVTLTNTDASNARTSVSVLYSTVDAVE